MRRAFREVLLLGSAHGLGGCVWLSAPLPAPYPVTPADLRAEAPSLTGSPCRATLRSIAPDPVGVWFDDHGQLEGWLAVNQETPAELARGFSAALSGAEPAGGGIVVERLMYSCIPRAWRGVPAGDRLFVEAWTADAGRVRFTVAGSPACDGFDVLAEQAGRALAYAGCGGGAP